MFDRLKNNLFLIEFIPTFATTPHVIINLYNLSIINISISIIIINQLGDGNVITQTRILTIHQTYNTFCLLII